MTELLWNYSWKPVSTMHVHVRKAEVTWTETLTNRWTESKKVKLIMPFFPCFLSLVNKVCLGLGWQYRGQQVLRSCLSWRYFNILKMEFHKGETLRGYQILLPTIYCLKCFVSQKLKLYSPYCHVYFVSLKICLLFNFLI